MMARIVSSLYILCLPLPPLSLSTAKIILPCCNLLHGYVIIYNIMVSDSPNCFIILYKTL